MIPPTAAVTAKPAPNAVLTLEPSFELVRPLCPKVGVDIGRPLRHISFNLGKPELPIKYLGHVAHIELMN